MIQFHEQSSNTVLPMFTNTTRHTSQRLRIPAISLKGSVYWESGSGGQRPPSDRCGSRYQPDVGQAAGGGQGEGDHRHRRCSPLVGIRRCWLLLGKASRPDLCSVRGPVRRAGADTPRPGCATRAPRALCQQSRPDRQVRRWGADSWSSGPYGDEGRRSFRRSSTSSFSASSTAGLISFRTKSVTLMPR